MKRDLERCKEKYIEEAKIHGFEYLGAASENSPSFYRKYKITSCGHIVDAVPVNVRNKSLRCIECFNLKINEEAAAVGLELISKIKSKLYEYKLPCGHIQEIFTSAVRTNEWICRTCHSSYFDLPSELYLLKIKSKDFEWLKLGYSRNLAVRIRSYKLQNSEVSQIRSIKFKTGREVIQIEQKLHSKYFQYRLNPDKMKEYHTQDGYTECYPIEMLEEFLHEFDKLEKNLVQ